MLKVLSCIAFEHDLRLVVLAAVICALASFTAINLLHHVRRSTGQMRAGWLAIAAAARLRNLGDAFHCDAGVHAGDSERL
jgi:diguanylate cyclase